MYMTVQRSFTHNSQKVETTQMSIIWWRDKCGISIQKLLFSNKNRSIWKTQWINLKIKDYKLCATLFMKFLKRTNRSDRNKSPLSSRGQEQEEGISCKGLYGNFYVIMECFVLWLLGSLTWLYTFDKLIKLYSFNLINFIVWKLYLNKGV